MVRTEKPLSEAVHPAPHRSHTEDLGGLLFLRHILTEDSLPVSGPPMIPRGTGALEAGTTEGQRVK